MRDFRDAKPGRPSLRGALAEDGVAVSSSRGLELIARAFGSETWNILSVRIKREAPSVPPRAGWVDATRPPDSDRLVSKSWLHRPGGSQAATTVRCSASRWWARSPTAFSCAAARPTSAVSAVCQLQARPHGFYSQRRRAGARGAGGAKGARRAVHRGTTTDRSDAGWRRSLAGVLRRPLGQSVWPAGQHARRRPSHLPLIPAKAGTHRSISGSCKPTTLTAAGLPQGQAWIRGPPPTKA